MLVGAGVTGAVGVAGAVAGVGLGDALRGRDELTSSTAKTYEFYPAEAWSSITVRPDGVQQVRTELLFDAGEGTRSPLQLYLPGDFWVGRRSGGGVLYARPVFSGLHLEVLAGPSTGAPLELADGRREKTARRQVVRAPGGWGPGRHCIRLEHEVSGLWVDVDGDPRLALYPVPIWPSWYRGSPTSVLQVEGRPRTWQVDSGRAPTDLGRPELITGRSSGSGYVYTVPEHITAHPVPPEVR